MSFPRSAVRGPSNAPSESVVSGENENAQMQEIVNEPLMAPDNSEKSKSFFCPLAVQGLRKSYSKRSEWLPVRIKISSSSVNL